MLCGERVCTASLRNVKSYTVPGHPERMPICSSMIKAHNRMVRNGLSQLMEGCPEMLKKSIANTVRQLDLAIEQVNSEAKNSPMNIGLIYKDVPASKYIV